MSRVWFAVFGLCCTAASFAEDLDYHVTDPDLKVVRLDSSPDDSFLSVRIDTEGRIFVGGRKTLFVYDLDESGKYRPRKLLFEFPDHTWVNDIEIRGDDLYIVTVSAVYRLPGARVQRDGLTIERLLWGVPNGHVHQCFHACAWGPEGDLYVSMGDPLWYYADGHLPAKYENSLMVARWCRRQVTYFPLEEKAGTFTATEHVLLEGRDQSRPVATTFRANRTWWRLGVRSFKVQLSPCRML